jgi:cyclophilin family peptidyl-prolyl cis-trans isomerase
MSTCVLLTTSLGAIAVDLFSDDCPRACANFAALCATGCLDNTLVRAVRRGVLIEFGDRSLAGGLGAAFPFLAAKWCSGWLAPFFILFYFSRC